MTHPSRYITRSMTWNPGCFFSLVDSVTTCQVVTSAQKRSLSPKTTQAGKRVGRASRHNGRVSSQNS